MSAAAEHALRTLADELQCEANSANAAEDLATCRIMYAMANAHRATADRLKAEREAREAQLQHRPSGFRYDPKGGNHGTR